MTDGTTWANIVRKPFLDGFVVLEITITFMTEEAILPAKANRRERPVSRAGKRTRVDIARTDNHADPVRPEHTRAEKTRMLPCQRFKNV